MANEHQQAVIRWGDPGCPLLPASALRSAAAHPLPVPLKVGRLRSVGDLAAFWESQDVALGAAQVAALREIFASVVPDDEVYLAPGGVDLRLLAHSYPVAARTRSRLHIAHRRSSPDGLTVGALLSVGGAGISTLLEVMVLCEQVFGEARRGSFQAPPWTSPSQAADVKSDVVEGPSLERLLAPLVAAAVEFHGCRTIADFFELELSTVNSELGELADLAGTNLTDIFADEWLTDPMIRRLGNHVSALGVREQLVLRERVVKSEGATLRELGEELGITRERVRQIAARLEQRLGEVAQPEMTLVVRVMRQRLGDFIPTADLSRVVGTMFRCSVEDERDASRPGAVEIARSLLRRNLGFDDDDGLSISERGRESIEDLRRWVESNCDDAGLIAEDDLRHQVEDIRWLEHWDHLLGQLGLTQFHRYLSTRSGRAPRVKAAILVLGKPSTKEEIAALAGLQLDDLSAPLSALSSVARATKDTWGLVEWIEDVYEGVSNEIAQRIEDGGGSVSLIDLLHELPSRFGVSEGTVRAYASTPRFAMIDGQVRFASSTAVAFAPLVDVVDGYDDEGNPFWTFTVETRFLDGFSLTGLPGAIAAHLGCQPDHKLRVELIAPKGCRPISISWPLSSLSGPTIGYLADPIRALGAAADDELRLVLGREGVRVEPCTASNVRAGSPSAMTFADRMKQRRRLQ